MKTIYLIGSLRNKAVPNIAKALRSEGFDVFDDWYAAGPEADDYWKSYSEARGQSYKEALDSYAAKHVFEFDKHHLDRADIGVLVMPAGKSGHLEMGYLAGQGKPTYLLFDGEPEPERWDVMVQFATGGIHYSVDELIEALNPKPVCGMIPPSIFDRINRNIDKMAEQYLAEQYLAAAQGKGVTWTWE